MFEMESPPAMQEAKEFSSNDEVFEIFFAGGVHANRAIGMHGDIGWRPSTDVYETEEEFIIQVDLAGMSCEDIEVFVEADFVVIKGVRSNIAPNGKKHFHKMEILVGPFERHVQIPAEVDATSAHAQYRSGFLFVQMKRGRGVVKSRTTVQIDT